VSFDDQIASKKIVLTYAEVVKGNKMYKKHTCDNNCNCNDSIVINDNVIELRTSL